MCDSRVGLEAQKLISISLGKMAASRVGRTGASLHKSLLVASVLQRARHVFLEESYNVHRATHPEAYPHPAAAQQQQQQHPPPPSPAGAVYTSLLPPAASPPTPTPSSSTPMNVVPSVAPSPPTASAPPAEDTCESEDKENRVCEKQQEPLQQQQGSRAPLSDHSSNSRASSLKRRRCVSQQETQEAVWSILPKRSRTALEQRASSPPADAAEQQQQQQQNPEPCGNSMEVEHITSLVSIFSFGGQRVDLCGAQAAREDLASYQPVALAV